MTVQCEITQCPYNKKSFCTDRAIKISAEGYCKWLKNPRWQEPVPDEYKEEINLITLAKKED